MALEGVDHIGVLVADLDAARAFATDVLGLTLEREATPPLLGVQAAFFRAGTVLIELFQIIEPSSSPIRPLEGGAQARLDHIAVDVDHIRATQAELEGQGVKMLDLDREGEPLPIGGHLHHWTVASTSGGTIYQLIEKGAG